MPSDTRFAPNLRLSCFCTQTTSAWLLLPANLGRARSLACSFEPTICWRQRFRVFGPHRPSTSPSCSPRICCSCFTRSRSVSLLGTDDDDHCTSVTASKKTPTTKTARRAGVLVRAPISTPAALVACPVPAANKQTTATPSKINHGPDQSWRRRGPTLRLICPIVNRLRAASHDSHSQIPVCHNHP